MSELKEYMIKVHGINYKVIEYPLGQLVKVCVCGWESKSFRDLTDNQCPQCKTVFRKDK